MADFDPGDMDLSGLEAQRYEDDFNDFDDFDTGLDDYNQQQQETSFAD